MNKIVGIKNTINPIQNIETYTMSIVADDKSSIDVMYSFFKSKHKIIVDSVEYNIKNVNSFDNLTIDETIKYIINLIHRKTQIKPTVSELANENISEILDKFKGQSNLKIKIDELEKVYNDIFDKVPDVNSPITKQIEIIRKQIRTLKDNLNKQ